MKRLKLKDSPRRVVNLLQVSKCRNKIMELFFINEMYDSQKVFYAHMRKVSRTINEHINSVRRELLNLEKVGFLKSSKDRIKKVYFINKDFILYQEYKAIYQKVIKDESAKQLMLPDRARITDNSVQK